MSSTCWMLTITGHEPALSGPEVQSNPVDIYDIAWSLSQVNRFTGHAQRPYSVAEHSLLVTDLARQDGKSLEVQLACLLHDAHEAFTNDLSTPAKNAVGLAWAQFETPHADRVRRALHVNDVFARCGPTVYHFDLVALATERLQLTRFNREHHREWPVLDTYGQEVKPATMFNLMGNAVANRRWKEWRDLFLMRYFDLARAVQASAPARQEVAA